MTVTRSQRHLVVVANLLTTSRRYKQLYRFLDASTVPLVELLCGKSYASVTRPPSGDGTLQGVVDTIDAALEQPNCKAVDLVIACHGTKGAIKFRDATWKMADLARRFAAVEHRERLRLAYDLSCYGETHAAAFVDIGFDAAIGSRAVNTNAAFELPTVLGAWTHGRPLGATVDAGNDSLNRELSDALAGFWFDDTDSFKSLTGDGAAGLTINTSPRPPAT